MTDLYPARLRATSRLSPRAAQHYLSNDQVRALHPVKTGRDDCMEAALVMVSERGDKYELALLVNALLQMALLPGTQPLVTDRNDDTVTLTFCDQDSAKRFEQSIRCGATERARELGAAERLREGLKALRMGARLANATPVLASPLVSLDDFIDSLLAANHAQAGRPSQ